MYHHHAVVAAVLCSMTFCFAQAQTSKATETKSAPTHQSAVVKSVSDTAKAKTTVAATIDTSKILKTVKTNDTLKTIQTAVVPPTDTAKAQKNADTNKAVKKTDTSKNVVPSNTAKPAGTSPAKPAVK